MKNKKMKNLRVIFIPGWPGKEERCEACGVSVNILSIKDSISGPVSTSNSSPPSASSDWLLFILSLTALEYGSFDLGG